jgi:hypothetical protein
MRLGVASINLTISDRYERFNNFGSSSIYINAQLTSYNPLVLIKFRSALLSRRAINMLNGKKVVGTAIAWV